jgi:peptidoglycan/LPS O-acetylase OafA/YrhL
MVVVYHIWPSALPGGFVGVDVFFVISGFLITTHLLSRPPTTGRALLGFWSRRIRRLLPAATLVLFCTLLATRLLAPETTWAQTGRQVRAASLYVVNWDLAHSSVNYLAASSESPVQHYWSLSVEEQFYIVWPLLLCGLCLLAARRRFSPRGLLLAGPVAIVLLSLGWSVWDTAHDPAAAYFVTPTRIWELGLGAVLASLALPGHGWGRPAPRSLRVTLFWAGVVAILVAGVTYSGRTPFPGWRAALPVLGSVAVIAARVPVERGTASRWVAWTPVKWVGDVSYSIYLWHWPLIMLLPYAVGTSLGPLDKVSVLLATLALAALTKKYVEDPFRTSNWGRPLAKSYILGAALMAVVVAAASLQLVEVRHRQAAQKAEFRAKLSAGATCFGAPAMTAPDPCVALTRSGSLVPSPSAVAEQQSPAWRPAQGRANCFAGPPSFSTVVCHYGDASARTQVTLIGNSHAAQWIPAIDTIAQRRHWRVTTYLATGCSLSYNLQDLVAKGMQAGSDEGCQAWSHRVVRQVTSHPADLVIMGNKSWGAAVDSSSKAESEAAYEQGYAGVLRALDRAGQRTIVIRDTPYHPTVSVPQCLLQHSDYAACGGARSDWLPHDQLVAAAHRLAGEHVRVVDMTKYVCSARRCPAVIGQVPVYFDYSHLSEAFVRTAAPLLARRLPQLSSS